MVIILFVGGLDAVGSGEGPRALMTTKKPARMGVGCYQNYFDYQVVTILSFLPNRLDHIPRDSGA